MKNSREIKALEVKANAFRHTVDRRNPAPPKGWLKPYKTWDFAHLSTGAGFLWPIHSMVIYSDMHIHRIIVKGDVTSETHWSSLKSTKAQLEAPKVPYLVQPPSSIPGGWG